MNEQVPHTHEVAQGLNTTSISSAGPPHLHEIDPDDPGRTKDWVAFPASTHGIDPHYHKISWEGFTSRTSTTTSAPYWKSEESAKRRRVPLVYYNTIGERVTLGWCDIDESIFAGATHVEASLELDPLNGGIRSVSIIPAPVQPVEPPMDPRMFADDD